MERWNESLWCLSRIEIRKHRLLRRRYTRGWGSKNNWMKKYKKIKKKHNRIWSYKKIWLSFVPFKLKKLNINDLYGSSRNLNLWFSYSKFHKYKFFCLSICLCIIYQNNRSLCLCNWSFHRLVFLSFGAYVYEVTILLRFLWICLSYCCSYCGLRQLEYLDPPVELSFLQILHPLILGSKSYHQIYTILSQNSINFR